MNFALFILLNAILLIRPEELLPEIAGLRLYLIVIVLCIATTLPGLLAQLSAPALAQRPITVCALGLLVAMTLSQLVHGRFDVVDELVPDFVKVLLYFFLLMAIINTPRRLIAFMAWLVVFVTVLATLGLLQYHEMIDVEALQPIEQKVYDAETGEVTSFPRLCSSGIYNDPNDLCLILVTGSLCCLCLASLARAVPLKLLCVLPIGLFGYAITLTQSRGGLLGLMSAVLALVYARFGWKKSLPLAAILLPALLLLFAGRQTDFQTGGEDTANARMQAWSEGLVLMMRNPLNVIAGIGVGEFEGEVGMVAHNSFVQAYVETGLFGGALFLCAFYLAGWGVWRTRRDGNLDDEPTLLKLQPFVFAMVVGYAAGIYSLTRNFVVPTYMVLGFAAAFMAMAYGGGVPDWFRLNRRLVKRLAIVGVLGLAFLKIFTQTMVQFG
jgi:O-antigen ligase